MRPDNEDFAWDLNRLRSAQAKGDLVFVLGAGINAPYGFPLWLELLPQLLLDSSRLPRLRRRGHKVPPAAEEEELAAIRQALESLSPDPLLQATAVRAAYASDDAWVTALEKRLALRQGANSPSDEHLPLRAIAHMLVTAALRSPTLRFSVLTFNFDNLLEDAIEAELKARCQTDPKQIEVHSVTTQSKYRESLQDKGIFIYHLHGSFVDKTSGPILDTLSYVPVLATDHWSRECLKEALVNKQGATALFLGLSIADPNLRFVLSHWSTTEERIAAYYIAAPPVPPKASTLTYFRQLAFMSRTIVDLYDQMLDKLQLVVYHLSSWAELNEILGSIEVEA